MWHDGRRRNYNGVFALYAGVGAMTIASCPKCHESVRIPSAVSQRATVRCPLCLEEFLVAEILDSLPPVLEVVDDPEEGFSDAEPLESAAAFGLAGPSAEDALDIAPTFSIDRLRDRSSAAPATSANRRRVPSRPQRKKKNPAAEVVKIVLGGIAGLVIAQLLLWWMPWQHLRRDPFTLGPSIAKYAPWLVPARFHGDLGTSQQESASSADLSPSGLPQRAFENLDVQEPSEPSAPPAKKQAPTRKPPSELPPADVEESVDPAILDDPLAATIELPVLDDPGAPGDDPFGLELPMDLESDPETDPVLDIESDPLPVDLMPEPAPEPSHQAAGTVRRLVSAPRFQVDDLTAALAEVEPVLEELAVADTDDAVDLLRKNYQPMAQLAEIVTGMDQEDVQQRQVAARLLLSLAEKPDVIPWLSRAGAAWARSTDRRSNNGILLVGKAKTVGQQEALYRTELVLSDGSTMACYSENDPFEAFEPGEQLLLVGVVVDQPSDELLGYTGQQETVIWSPFFRVVPE
jgi:hypothetical protein